MSNDWILLFPSGNCDLIRLVFYEYLHISSVLSHISLIHVSNNLFTRRSLKARAEMNKKEAHRQSWFIAFTRRRRTKGKITRLSLARIRWIRLLIGQFEMNFPFGSGTEVCFAICRRSGVSPATVWRGNYLEEVPCDIGIRGAEGMPRETFSWLFTRTVCRHRRRRRRRRRWRQTVARQRGFRWETLVLSRIFLT